MPCESSYQQLLARLELLERDRRGWEALARQNRLLRRCLCGVAVVLGVAIFSGGYAPTEGTQKIEPPAEQAPPPAASRQVVAQRLAIVDENGIERIVLGFDKFHKDSGESVPALFVFDGKGNRRAMLGGDADTAGLWLAEEGRTRLSITTAPGKFAGLGVFAEPGKPDRGQIGLFYADDGNPMLALNDRNGTTRVGVGLFERGKPAMSLNNAAGEPVFSQGEP